MMKRLLILMAMAAIACGDDDSSHEDEEGGGELPMSDASTCADVTYANFGKGFIDTYCVSCHGANVTGAARMAAPTDDVFDMQSQVKAKRAEIKEQVVTFKEMPFGPNSLKPTDADRTKFGAWLDCGAN